MNQEKYVTMSTVEGQVFVAFMSGGTQVSGQYYDTFSDAEFDVTSFLED